MKKTLLTVVASIGMFSACSRQPEQPQQSPAKASSQAQAPEVYKVRFATTKGDFVVEVHRNWSPNGADRFHELVKAGFYDDTAFFRAIDSFMVQFGISGLPALNQKWRDANIPDDPPAGKSNLRGNITFAMSGPNSRTTQVFVNYVNNANLDSMGFTPFGSVVEGMEVLDSVYKDYGEGAPSGNGPDQGKIQMEGNVYLMKQFPKLDYIKTARIAQ
jgi:peptidyl-prolyl cis-trans isomerase A (cyclophilin A)